jgi:hypothetical protein
VDETDVIMKDPSYIVWSPVRRYDIAWNFEKFLVDHKGVPYKRWVIVHKRVSHRMWVVGYPPIRVNLLTVLTYYTVQTLSPSY